MGAFSIILIVGWSLTLFEGIYGFVKGHFYREEEKVKKHEPHAYRKWIKLSSILFIICGGLNIIWSILDGFSGENDIKYIIFILVTVAVVIAIVSIAYVRIVKPADKANGIESEFDKILKDNKNNKK